MRDAKEAKTFKHSLAILIATTIPAMAANNVLSSHEVRFEGDTFICGKMMDSGKVRQFIHSTPVAKYLPEYEPAASDPRAKSWAITYRDICEVGHPQPNVTAHVGRKRY